MNEATEFISNLAICFDDLFDGRLEAKGIHEDTTARYISETRRVLTDGYGYLWVIQSDWVHPVNGSNVSFMCYTNGAYHTAGRIVDAIEDVFDVTIYSEYDPEYHGLKTQEELEELRRKWGAEEAAMMKEHDDEFATKLMHYCRGEPHNIDSTTLGMGVAMIAKELASVTQASPPPNAKMS
jgi:hypothetical protein